MGGLHARYDVTAFRFVDDLLVGYERFIRNYMLTFSAHDIGGRCGTRPRMSTSCTGRRRAAANGL